ncbi:winged helix DNA-binding domain-containing protein [Paramicrobacterium agarici]|uniref:winged helix DNA-binding domain-containing protein n=1 Tax=Paramicrobacterium agarici TaxID=630514 RepID=UPI000BF67753|nr:winged helix DNA-binding domain-containing protein [Microbacterium agarici]
MIRELTPAQLRRARWLSLGLGVERQPSAGAVVDRLGALQGQDLPGVLHSLAIRLERATVDDISREFDDKTLVRGWPMRGTLHVLRAEDLRPLTRITRKRVLGSMAGRARALNITDAEIDDVMLSVSDDLISSGPVTRAELRDSVGRAYHGGPSSQTVSHLIYRLAVSGTICHGPFRDGQQLIVHTDSWIGHRAESDAEEFLARMLRRFVSGHGPVSDADAARWFGLPLTTIRAARTRLGDAICTVETTSGPQWMVTGAETEQILASLHRRPPVRLLPGFDEFMLGYGDRSFAVPEQFLDEIVPGGNGMFRATVCSGASVIGTWSKAKKRGAVAVAPFSDVTPSMKNAIRVAAREVERVTGNQVTVQFPD